MNAKDIKATMERLRQEKKLLEAWSNKMASKAHNPEAAKKYAKEQGKIAKALERK